MIEIILAFVVGYLCGGVHMIASCHKKVMNGWISTSTNVYRCELVDIENAPVKQ